MHFHAWRKTRDKLVLTANIAQVERWQQLFPESGLILMEQEALALSYDLSSGGAKHFKRFSKDAVIFELAFTVPFFI